MYPDLFGISGFSMVVMILLGIIAASVLFFLYLKKINKKIGYLDLSIVIIATVLVGVVFAILFENAYEAIKHSINGEYPSWTWAMTFYGGLFGGVITFIMMYRFYYLRHNEPIFSNILIIAPACIAFGHAFGRIGCFLSGCCYGIETHTALDVYFPIHDHYYLPTQLFEMAFLFVLAAVLSLLVFKKITRYTFIVYMLSYGMFRFVIEFFRGDERGQLIGLSPSQYWCIILVVGTIPLYFLLKKVFFKEKKDEVSRI